MSLTLYAVLCFVCVCVCVCVQPVLQDNMGNTVLASVCAKTEALVIA